MANIALTQEKIAIVDEEDYEKLSQFKWYAILKGSDKWYARRQLAPGTSTYVYMHVDILGMSGVDHINGNGLDNRKSNLRPATQQQQRFNQLKTARPTSSAFKGVTWNQGRWVASIKHNGKYIYLGRFRVEADAARAYDKKAIELFGQFANLNFPDE